ncbi:MAG: hypothetical protein ABH851_04560 [Methanobacteriota archaeon]
MIQKEECLSRWIEGKITGFNGNHTWNFHRIPHVMLNGTLIGSFAAIILIFMVLLRIL